MKKLVYTFLFLLLIFICCQKIFQEEQDKIMSIDFLDKTYFVEFYLLNNFIDNESCIKHLFDFANNKYGRFFFVTHKKAVHFEDGNFFLEEKYPNFYFENRDSLKSNNYEFIRLTDNAIFTFLNNKDPNPLFFSIKKDAIKKKLSTDFDSLNLDMVQNMLNFARVDSAKFHTYNYTYELYNKDGIKKVVINYYEKGTWFDIEVLQGM